MADTALIYGGSGGVGLGSGVDGGRSTLRVKR